MVHRTRPRGRRGWTRRSAVASLLHVALARFITVYPWAAPERPGLPRWTLEPVLLTAAEVLALDRSVPASMAPEAGHNDGPSWDECVALATAVPAMLFAGRWVAPTRADEGLDLDAVYVPQPETEGVGYQQAITRPDGRCCPPDEDDLETIKGRTYRRLWWD